MKDFIILLAIAILSGMGVGGGGLLVIYLALFEGTEQITAQGANLMLFIIAALASTVFNARKKKIIWKVTLPMSLSGIAAALLGVMIAGKIDPHLLRQLFGAMLILGGAHSLLTVIRSNKRSHSSE